MAALTNMMNGDRFPSTGAVRDVRFTSTPAVAGQRSTAGFSLQVGNDCSSGSVCSESQDRF
jgi:hypothetical protein